MNDITFEIGSVNKCGIEEVYYVERRRIRRWPTIDNDIEAIMQGDYAEYEGNIELQTGYVWKIFYSTEGKGKISWEYQGETDCKVILNKASLSYPEITNEIRAFAKLATNGDFVFCVKHDKKYYIIGSKEYRATVTTTGDSGDTPGSDKGVKVDIECPDVTPLPSYKGILVLTNGVLDCNTDTFINYQDMNTNEIKDYTNLIENNSVRFEAFGKEGRIHLEGSGPILMEVSVDGMTYATVEHEVEFENGVAIAPVAWYIGDKIRISATTLTKVEINYNSTKIY